jgi:gamma-glutamylcyclotransferase (GGCT)/AIG2-like uncharacterized protein YtfP
MNKVFVYGSLKQGFHNHRLLALAKKVGDTEIMGYKMVNLGQFPGIISDIESKTPIKGEVYEVNAEQMATLDRLEGHPHFYMRFPVTTDLGTAWVYTLSEKDWGNKPIVESGEWKRDRAA